MPKYEVTAGSDPDIITGMDDTEKLKQMESEKAICYGLRIPVAIMVIFSVVIYGIGALISGFAFKSNLTQMGNNCSYFDSNDSEIESAVDVTGFESNLVVVGPCFMAFGTGVLLTIVFQWCFCRPLLFLNKSDQKRKSNYLLD